jgi:hypothetical protein
MFILRTFVGEGVEKLLPTANAQFQEFANYLDRTKKGFKDSDLESDLRGPHVKSIDGYDRNNKQVCAPCLLNLKALIFWQIPSRTAFSIRNKPALDKLFDKQGAVYKLE